MRIAFSCEQCGANYKVDADRAGQTAKCRHCGAKLRVPVPPPPVETSESGSPILRHTERSKPFEVAIGDGDHIDAISEHIEQHIGEVTMVFHEIVSDLVHIDVHHVLPTEDRDFHTLITSGMSDKPMNVPDGAEVLLRGLEAASRPAERSMFSEAATSSRRAGSTGVAGSRSSFEN